MCIRDRQHVLKISCKNVTNILMQIMIARNRRVPGLNNNSIIMMQIILWQTKLYISMPLMLMCFLDGTYHLCCVLQLRKNTRADLLL